MHLDVLDLRQFYYRTRLGRVAQTAVRDALLGIWPDAKAQTMAGFGFAVPLLRPYLAEARRVISLMPGPQGVMPWPAGMPNVSVLCSETHWPVATGSLDKLVVMHGLETSETPSGVLEECGRVLGPGGRAVLVVPNRAGLWARRDGTPFGYGRPYSLGQLEAQVKSHGFAPEGHATALYAPPSERRFWLRSHGLWERSGQRMSALMSGGVFLLEVSKQVHKPMRSGAPDAVRRPLRVLGGIPAAGAEPVSGRVQNPGDSPL